MTSTALNGQKAQGKRGPNTRNPRPDPNEVHDFDPLWRLARCGPQQEGTKFAKDPSDITCGACYKARQARDNKMIVLEEACKLDALACAAQAYPMGHVEALVGEVRSFLNTVRSRVF